MGFRIDRDTLTPGLKKFGATFRTSVDAAMHARAPQVASYAKTHAPWSDNTGAARAGLTATVTQAPRQWEITLAHSVGYGIWLEIRWAGKYEVIVPTLRAQGRELFAELERVLDQ